MLLVTQIVAQKGLPYNLGGDEIVAWQTHRKCDAAIPMIYIHSNYAGLGKGVQRSVYTS